MDFNGGGGGGGGYTPGKSSISYFLTDVSKELDKLLVNYDNILLLGDLNSSVHEKNMEDFCEMYDLENLIGAHLF